MSNSRNSRRGNRNASNKYWKNSYHRTGRVLTRSVLATQKHCGVAGVEDLPQRTEYSDIWDARW